MKKEYYLPLAIIIGTIIIGLSIYLGTTAEYRGKRAYCEKFIKEVNPKDSKKTVRSNLSRKLKSLVLKMLAH